ncbi:MAG TPA: DUF5961 family protein [Caulobacteraceae bacterium]|jgi:hypothetical protein|nr:DUF5961 family protein [Caulobacteraceae bacterium]
MDADEPRTFRAHCSNDEAPPTALLIPADSFEAAALIFAETWHGESESLRIVVVDDASGERQCFTVDLPAGA